jgi:hypothetical protein
MALSLSDTQRVSLFKKAYLPFPPECKAHEGGDIKLVSFTAVSITSAQDKPW